MPIRGCVVVTAGEPPPFEPPQRPREPDEFEPEPPRTNLAMVALIAFAFGVFLHGCVALSILDNASSSGNGSSSSSDRPTVEPAVTVGVEATPTRLPDRQTCAEIQGTDYRSTAERDFYRANCLATATPQPSPSASPRATATATRTPG